MSFVTNSNMITGIDGKFFEVFETVMIAVVSFEQYYQFILLNIN